MRATRPAQAHSGMFKLTNSAGFDASGMGGSRRTRVLTVLGAAAEADGRPGSEQGGRQRPPPWARQGPPEVDPPGVTSTSSLAGEAKADVEGGTRQPAPPASNAWQWRGEGP